MFFRVFVEIRHFLLLCLSHSLSIRHLSIGAVSLTHSQITAALTSIVLRTAVICVYAWLKYLKFSRMSSNFPSFSLNRGRLKVEGTAIKGAKGIRHALDEFCWHLQLMRIRAQATESDDERTTYFNTQKKRFSPEKICRETILSEFGYVNLAGISFDMPLNLFIPTIIPTFSFFSGKQVKLWINAIDKRLL